MTKTKSPGACGAVPGSGEAKAGCANSSATSALSQPRKWARVLRALVDGRTLNRFEAARELRDWCLNTTISQLEQRGITVLRHDETVPGAFGAVRCCRYKIAPESVQFARGLLGLPSPAGSPLDAHSALEQAA